MVRFVSRATARDGGRKQAQRGSRRPGLADAAALAVRADHDVDAAGQPRLKFRYVRNHADHSPAGILGLAERHQGADGQVERLRIERAKALVDEQRIQPNASAICTTSDKPSASARAAMKPSPPDKVVAARC